MKKIIIAILTVISLVICTGCGYGTNYPKKYKKFLDYTFGGDYTVELVEKKKEKASDGKEYGYRTWDITYTDKNGIEHKTDLYSTSKPFNDDDFEKNHDDIEMVSFANIEQGQVVKHEFCDKLLSKYYTIEDIDKNTMLFTSVDGGKFAVYFSNVVVTDIYTNLDELDRLISNKNGINISETDLKSYVQDKENIFNFSLVLENDDDVEAHVENVRKLIDEFVQFSEKPMNYEFTVSIKQDEISTKKVFKKSLILGQYTSDGLDIENGLDTSKDTSFSKRVSEALEK